MILGASLMLCVGHARGAQKLISDVPNYDQDIFPIDVPYASAERGDCVPVACAMLHGYYDSHGWPRLIPYGISSLEENAWGVDTVVRHYKDELGYTPNVGVFFWPWDTYTGNKLGDSIVSATQRFEPNSSFSRQDDEITNWERIKEYLNADNPCVLVVQPKGPDDSYKWENTSTLQGLGGGHAVCAVGWSDEDGRWVICNMGWPYTTRAWFNYDTSWVYDDWYISQIKPGGIPTENFRPDIFQAGFEEESLSVGNANYFTAEASDPDDFIHVYLVREMIDGSYHREQEIAWETYLGNDVHRYATDVIFETAGVWRWKVYAEDSLGLRGWFPSDANWVPDIWASGHILVSAVAKPTFSLQAGFYSTPLDVTIACGTSGATIRYTTDGTTPTESSTVYSGAVHIGQSTNLSARGFKSGMAPSEVAVASYILSLPGTVQAPVLSPAGGTYQSSVDVTMSCGTSGATIRYTTNGSEPTEASTQYTGSIHLTSTCTVKAKAFKSGMNSSATSSGTYTIAAAPGAAPTVSSVNGGSSVPPSASRQWITIRGTNFRTGFSATFRDETNAYTYPVITDPTRLTYVGGSEVRVYAGVGTETATWSVRITNSDGTTSNVFPFSVQAAASPGTVATPVFDAPGGHYSQPFVLHISCATVGALIYYTTTGEEPTESSMLYGGDFGSGVYIERARTIKAKAFKSGMNPSATQSASYTISSPIAVFTPSPGTYSVSVDVAINSAEDRSATFRYTTDGTEPTTSSTTYTPGSVIHLTQDTTLKAKGYYSGCEPSPTTTGVYTVTQYIEKGTELPVAPYLYGIGTLATCDQITLYWRKVIDSHYNDNVNFYEVQYALNSSFSNPTLINAGNPATGTNMYETISHTVTGLSDNSHYYFRVRGVNNVGTGPWSNVEDIQIDIQDWPYFDTGYQEPSNGATNVSKTPILRWRAFDPDGDDLDYFVTFGEDPGNLWWARAFNSAYKGQNYYDFSEEYFEPLKPNTRYYWQIWVREDGYYRDYYGGEYIKSPMWTFTTTASGNDMAITNVELISELTPDSEATFRITVRNNGSEPAPARYFRPFYIKNGAESPFWSYDWVGTTSDLPPGGEESLDISVRFREQAWENNGYTYDNVLISGNSQVRFAFAHNDTQDTDWTNDDYTITINYVDAGGPIVDFFDLDEYGRMYAPWSKFFWARMGQDLWIILTAHDDIMVAKCIIQYRYHSGDSWVTLYEQENQARDFVFRFDNGSGGTYSSNFYTWPVPTDIVPTDDAQIRILLYDDKGNETIKTSDPFSIVSNRIASNITILSEEHKVGGNLIYQVDYDGDYPAGSVNTYLRSGANGASLPSMYDPAGITFNNPYTWTIPNYNSYASNNCYLEFRMTDIKGNELKVLSETFTIQPNTELPPPFDQSIEIYSDECVFPADALYKGEEREVLFVDLEDDNVVHTVVEHKYYYTAVPTFLPQRTIDSYFTAL